MTETMPQTCPVRQPGLKAAGIESKEPAEIKGGDRCKVAWKYPLRSRARSLFHCSGKVKQRRLATPKVGSRQVRRSTRHKVRKSRIVEALACSSGEQKPIPRVERISVRATASGKRTKGRGDVIFPAAMVVPASPKKVLDFQNQLLPTSVHGNVRFQLQTPGRCLGGPKAISSSTKQKNDED